VDSWQKNTKTSAASIKGNGSLCCTVFTLAGASLGGKNLKHAKQLQSAMMKKIGQPGP